MNPAPAYRVLGRFLVFGLFVWGTSAIPVRADAMEAGIAIVTTIHGEVSMTNSAGQPVRLKLHQRMPLNALRVETGTSGYLGLSLSNNTGLFVGPKTRLHLVRFRQQPFGPDKESRDYEPSRSQTELLLDDGRIAVAAPGLSPLSTFEVSTVAGTVSVRGATGLIQSGDGSTSVASSNGNFVIVRADTGARSFVSADQGICIEQLKGAAQQTESRFARKNFSASFQELVGAAKHARSRTLFRVLREGPAIPRPFLVAKKPEDRPPSPQPDGLAD